MRVTYNDLVSQDVHVRDKVTRSLFEFIGIPFSKEVAKSVENFRRGYGETTNKTRKEKNDGFYGVYRPDNYDPDHWKYAIKREVRASENQIRHLKQIS